MAKPEPVEYVEAVVIGAGVIGLAVARELALRGLEVLVLESAAQIGTETSSRNSEVIHAGIYYPQGSLKARLCVRGKALLYDYLKARSLPHRRCGKLIVATQPEQRVDLAHIEAKAVANDVTDLQWLTAAQVQVLEPDLFCEGALLSPSTGILDSHQYMLSLQGDALRQGVLFALKTPVLDGDLSGSSLQLRTGGDAPMRLRTRYLINAAGLQAVPLLKTFSGFPAAQIPPHFYAKGNYFGCTGASRFRHLIYPVPEPGGLGVHVTLDMAGQVRLGPDVEWVEQPDYQVDVRRSDRFYEVVRRYWPALAKHSLQPAYAGVRPKLSGPGEAAVDFMIQDATQHGVPGLVNLLGIESPGLTASLALAEEAVDRLLS